MYIDCCLKEQESRRAYGTAVSGVVIHLNKMSLDHSQILTIAQCSNNPNPHYVALIIK